MPRKHKQPEPISLGRLIVASTLQTDSPSGLAFGATASSEGTQPVCRLPLAAFVTLTSGIQPRRPAAVIRYDNKVSGQLYPLGIP
jgi:hypothetical protein